MKNNDFEEDRTRRAEKKDNKSTQEEPKMVPWLPRSSQETPKSTPEKPRRPPRDPQERPKEAQESPKTLWRPPSDRRRRFFKNRAAAEAGARFLRVGGSSWRPKIDPKRLQETIRNDFEEAKPRRSEKKDTKATKRGQRETQERPKSEGARAWQPFWVDLEVQKCSQETPKSTQEEPKRAPKRSQDHLRFENLDFSKIDECPS
jgi:hypothetical protein